MSVIAKNDLEALNAKVKERGYVDREHIVEFLTLIPTSEAMVIIREIKEWLQALHNDPTYEKVMFSQGDIDAIIGDLDSYGRVRPDTIYDFKENSSRELKPV